MNFEKDYFFGNKSNYFNYDFQKKFNLGRYKNIVLKYKKSGKILDIGCADGSFLNKLPDSFDKYGLDVSRFMIEKCSHSHNSIAHNIENPLNNGWKNFDVITAFDSLEHILNLGLALENIKKLLRKKGYFIISVPYTNRLIPLLFDRDRTHYHLMKLKAWVHLLQEYFKIIEIKKGFIGCYIVMRN